MAPALKEQVTDELLKRYWYYDAYGNRRWRSSSPWWLVFAIGVPVFILVLLCLARRSNLNRRKQGAQPIPYTGWTTFGGGQQQQYQQNPPYQPPQQQQPYYSYGQPPQQDQQYYSYKPEGDSQNPPPEYDRPDGPPPGVRPNDSTTEPYDRPDGPPPGTTNYPSYPTETFKR